MDRAYALLHVKAIDDDLRSFEGIATTPTPDRAGDILDPLGVSFKNPVPLLLHHDRGKPVGRVEFDAPTPLGIKFKASIPALNEPGIVKDRLDEAWHSIKSGLLSGVSVGFRVLANGAERLKSGGALLKRVELCELSLVTIPANTDATITLIKSLDVDRPTLPVVTLPKEPKMITKETTAQQITAYEATRKVKSDRLAELMSTAAEGNTTLDADGTKEYDGLKAEVDAIDAHLGRLRDFEKSQAAAAVPVVDKTTEIPVNGHKDYAPVITVRAVLPKGTGFVRYAMAKAYAQGDTMKAIQFAEQWKDSTPEVVLALKAAVAPGNTTDAVWAGPLVPPLQNLTAEFMELLRPATIIGKIPNLRRVPFNVAVPTQTAGGSYGWVGQGAPKPVTKLAFDKVTLGFAKVAGIIVITEELARFSTPDAESLIRNDMIAGIAQFLDTQFVDPAIAPVANVSPGSITNGIAPIAAGANAAVDFGAIVGAFMAALIPLSSVTIIMSEANAFSLGMQFYPAGGARVYPGMSAQGGEIAGVRVVTSSVVGTNIIGIAAPYVLYADDGGVTIDVSREASVQMESAPDNPAAATTVLVSLWQQNLVGLRAERFANWSRAKPAAVHYVTGANYQPTSVGGQQAAPPPANGHATHEAAHETKAHRGA